LKLLNLSIILSLFVLFISCDDDSGGNTCDDIDCGIHGECVESNGNASCACEEGYDFETLCVECATGYQDNDSDGTCLPSCAMLNFDCSNNGSCVDASGVAVCDCDEGFTDDGSGNCIISTAGDSCDNPIDLDLSGGVITGSTVGAENDLSGRCVKSTDGGDMIYTFTITEQLTITFSVTGFDTVLYLRMECGSEGIELACDDDGVSEGGGSLISPVLFPGTYFLIVDGYDTEGDYVLTTSVECASGLVYNSQIGTCVNNPCEPNPCNDEYKHTCEISFPDSYSCSCDPGAIEDPQNSELCIQDASATGESCLEPVMIMDSTGTIYGSTTGGVNDLVGSCGGDGADNVYVFTIDKPSMVSFQMQNYDTVLYLRNQCANPVTEIACSDDDGDNEGGSLVEQLLEPGTYFVIADSYSTGGDYIISYFINPNPCVDDEAKCPGAPVCKPDKEWLNYTCECPAGSLLHNGDCVDDPCLPNPCGDFGKGKCEVNLPASYTCLCEAGYMVDATTPGECISDPSASEWAIIVFLNADNNLEVNGIEDVDEMSLVGSSTQLDIVTLLDLYEEEGGVSRVLYITESGYNVIENYGEVDMSDWRVLRDFGIYAVENYPARRYAFVMWDHGNGWTKSTLVKNPLFKGFSNDDHGTEEEISISNGDFAKAMAPIVSTIGRKIDILAFDACLMGMWEVAHASKPFAKYFVASSETEPVSGYAYDLALAPLITDSTITPVTLGESIVETYFNEDSSNSTLTLSNLENIDTLTNVLSDFAIVLMANQSIYSQLESVRQNTQSFTYSSFIDLYDFAKGVSQLSGIPSEVITAANALMVEVNNTVLYHRAQTLYDGSYGLSIYLPQHQTSMDPLYTGLGATWSQNSSWDEFIISFMQ
jgi:Clostripain family/EGF-like domain